MTGRHEREIEVELMTVDSDDITTISTCDMCKDAEVNATQGTTKQLKVYPARVDGECPVRSPHWL